MDESLTLWKICEVERKEVVTQVQCREQCLYTDWSGLSLTACLSMEEPFRNLTYNISDYPEQGRGSIGGIVKATARSC